MKQVLLCFAFVLAIESATCKDPILVHALFRHGHRTPQEGTFYPNDPYKNSTFYPYGLGQLTNKGKAREYDLGQFLRNRYNNFLGDTYTPTILDARSTDYNRTKMSLELVLAGLFPPKGDQIWEPSLNWQPIPFNYWQAENDELLDGYATAEFAEERQKLVASPQLQLLFKEHQDLYTYLSENSGLQVTNYDGVQQIYDVLKAEFELELMLPEWTKSVYPDVLEPISARSFALNAGNLRLRQMSAGALLQKIVKDTLNKINGFLDPPDRKLFLYSAHDLNVGVLLTTLDIFDNRVPPYGGCVLIEVHYIAGVYGVKIFYRNYVSDQPQLLKLPECEEFCPLDEFVTIAQQYFPTN